MKHIAYFLLLSIFIAPLSAPKAQEARALSQNLHNVCIKVPDGAKCLKTIKNSTKQIASNHMRQFEPGSYLAQQDAQYAQDARSILKDYCDPVFQSKTYDMSTMQKRQAMLLDVTDVINKCLKAMNATKVEDKTGHVTINENAIFVVFYNNSCMRGALDPQAKKDCQEMARQGGIN